MDISLPSGKMVKGIPEGIGKDEIRSKLISSGAATDSDFTIPAAKVTPIRDTVSQKIEDPNLDSEGVAKSQFTSFLKQKGYDVDISTADSYRTKLFGSTSSYGSINKQLTNELSVEPLGPRKSAAVTSKPMGYDEAGRFIKQIESQPMFSMAMAGETNELIRFLESPEGMVAISEQSGEIPFINASGIAEEVLTLGQDVERVVDRGGKPNSYQFGAWSTKIDLDYGLNSLNARKLNNIKFADQKYSQFAPEQKDGFWGKATQGFAGSLPAMLQSIALSPTGVGPSLFWQQQGAGNIIRTYLADKDANAVDLQRMTNIANTMAIPYAAVELAVSSIPGMKGFGSGIDQQVTNLIFKKMTPSVMKKISTGGAAFGIRWLLETMEEGGQGAVVESARQWLEKSGIDLGKIMDVAIEDTKGAAGTTLLMTAAGTGAKAMIERGGKPVAGHNGGPLTTDDIATLRRQPEVMENLEPSEEADLLRKAVDEENGSALAEYNQRVVGVEEDVIETPSKQAPQEAPAKEGGDEYTVPTQLRRDGVEGEIDRRITAPEDLPPRTSDPEIQKAFAIDKYNRSIENGQSTVKSLDYGTTVGWGVLTPKEWNGLPSEFLNTQVKTDEGQIRVVAHGTGFGFKEFADEALGKTTGAPSAKQGHFFAADAGTPSGYLRAGTEAAGTAKTQSLIASIAVNEVLMARKYPSQFEGGWEAVKEQEFSKLSADDRAVAESMLESGGAAGGGIEIKPRVIRSVINLQNPLVFDFKGEGRVESYNDLLIRAQNEGRDGAIFKNTTDGGPKSDIFVVFDTKNIHQIDEFTYTDGFKSITKPAKVASYSEALSKPAPQEAPAIETGSKQGAVEEAPSAMMDTEVPLKEMSATAQKILDFGESTKAIMKKATSLTTRIGEISPEIKMAVRKTDQAARLRETAATESTAPFFQSISELTEAQRTAVKSDLANGNYDSIEALGVKGIAEVRAFLDQTATDLGINTLENYFPRKVTDYEGLVKAIGSNPKGAFEQAIAQREAKKGSELTEKERLSVIRGTLQKRGGTGLGQKSRTIETVTDEMLEFYEDPLQTLQRYIHVASMATARKEFLGTVGTTEDADLIDDEGDFDVAKIIDSLVEQNDLSFKEQTELQDLLTAQLGYKTAPKWVNNYRRLVSLKFVTKVKTSIKQFGDMFVSMGENGIANTITAGKEQEAWTDELGKQADLSLQEIGIENLDTEIAELKRGKLEEAIFTPLTLSDKFNKEWLVKSSARNWRTMAESNPAKLKEKLMEKFGVESFVDNVIADISRNVATPDVKFALYSQMADFHPISHSENIKFYIENPTTRFMFALKSFAFKRLDRLYREALRDGIEGTTTAVAGAVDGDKEQMKDGTDQMAKGAAGFARFLFWSIGGEVLINQAYKAVKRALGVEPEAEEEELEMWTDAYLQELSTVAPFINPYAVKMAVDRKNAWTFVERSLAMPAPFGSDVMSDFAVWLATDEPFSEMTKWKKDIPYLGEFMVGSDKAQKARSKKSGSTFSLE